MKRREVNFGSGVLASAEAEAEQQAYYRRKVLGGASTMLIALGYALYKLFWSSGFGSS